MVLFCRCRRTGPEAARSAHLARSNRGAPMALAGPTKIMDAVAGPPRPHSELFPLLWDQLLSRLRRAFCGAGSASQKYAPASARAKARFKPSAFAAASPPLPRAVLPAGNRKEERADGLRLTPFASAPKEPEGGGGRGP